MALRARHALIWLVGAFWLWVTWRFVLGSPSPDEIGPLFWSDRLRDSDSTLLGLFAATIATMVAVDRLFCRFLDRRYGVDPLKVHWSRLRTRDGDYFCAACGSVFMLPPEDLSEAGFVHCGDCGHPVAPYGEMKPYFPERLRARGIIP